MEPRDQVLHLAVGPLDELADVQNRSFLQSSRVWRETNLRRHRSRPGWKSTTVHTVGP